MKSINRNDFELVGTVVRTHGNFGELKIQLNQAIKFKKWAFLEIREKPVPFLVKSFRVTSPDQGLIQLIGPEDVTYWERFAGHSILVPRKKGKKAKAGFDEDLIGFLLIDEVAGELGRVEELLEMPMQLLIKTTYKNKELLIPAVEPLVSYVDPDAEEIGLNLPEGFLED
ncbi:MAG: hypothetical protein LCH37_06715 [Bacteroidetes bacterium]|nr:hypothetical protein [Bacteroidota bacterium]